MNAKIEDVKCRIEKLLIEKGLRRFDARMTAKALTLTEAYGVYSHGLKMLPAHLRKIELNQYNLKPQFQIMKKTSSFAVGNADNAIGFSSAYWAMTYAVEHAKENGIYTFFCNHANTYGAAFLYSVFAVGNGLIGFTCCNSPAAMAPLNGKGKLFGTNPFSVAFPTMGEPIIVDMATSKVAKSKILQKKNAGEEIPMGWALNSEGLPTTDPDEALSGFVCPMEGAKGYALSMAIDLFAGLLSGAAWQGDVGKFYTDDVTGMNVGQLFVAIDPIKVLGESYFSLISEYRKRIYDSPPIDEKHSIRIPGDNKNECFRLAADCGLSISPDIKRLLYFDATED